MANITIPSFGATFLGKSVVCPSLVLPVEHAGMLIAALEHRNLEAQLRSTTGLCLAVEALLWPVPTTADEAFAKAVSSKLDGFALLTSYLIEEYDFRPPIYGTDYIQQARTMRTAWAKHIALHLRAGLDRYLEGEQV